MAGGQDLMEALRPKSVQELHASVAAGSRTQKSLPPIVAQLQQFVEQRAACEERCVARLRGRAVTEAGLLPCATVAADNPAVTREAAEQQMAKASITGAVNRRFGALESRCAVLCGSRLSHLIGGS
ncbi:unnamed protein product [Polarella glacialis]|uniref:Uncharacterized protein n=1 Tax=Polarella glacialis TaxID=89957 RepID=A0A813G5P4_POLGL|nr:unnamed protein product [Polarella glacialis]